MCTKPKLHNKIIKLPHAKSDNLHFTEIQNEWLMVCKDELNIAGGAASVLPLSLVGYWVYSSVNLTDTSPSPWQLQPVQPVLAGVSLITYSWALLSPPSVTIVTTRKPINSLSEQVGGREGSTRQAWIIPLWKAALVTPEHCTNKYYVYRYYSMESCANKKRLMYNNGTWNMWYLYWHGQCYYHTYSIINTIIQTVNSCSPPLVGFISSHHLSTSKFSSRVHGTPSDPGVYPNAKLEWLQHSVLKSSLFYFIHNVKNGSMCILIRVTCNGPC